MVKIEDKLAEMQGILKFKLEDGTEFELKPRIKHKRGLAWLDKKKITGTIKEEDFDKEEELIKEILKESYPIFKDKDLDNIMLRYSGEILLELLVGLGLRDKKMVEIFRKKQKEEIDKLLGSDEKPEKKRNA